MKKPLTLIIIILLPLLALASNYYRVTADVLNIRNQPSKHSEVIGVLKRGEIVAVHSNSYDEWMRISTSSTTGYVSSQYLEYSHSTDNTQASTKTERKITIKKIIGKIIGWLIPILLIILSFHVGDNSVWYDVYEDGTMVKRRQDDGGSALFFIGIIWLGIKLYLLFR